MRKDFNPKIWGPHAWFFLESVTMAYPTKPSFDEKKAAEQFFNSLQFMIPCDKCRNNYKLHLKKYPLTSKILSSRDNLFMWLVDVHNSVNSKKTNRSYDETFQYYNKQYNFEIDENITENKSENKPCKFKNFLFYLLMISIILFLLYHIYQNI